jgi:hypothetical protein
MRIFRPVCSLNWFCAVSDNIKGVRYLRRNDHGRFLSGVFWMIEKSISPTSPFSSIPISARNLPLRIHIQ